MEVYSASSMGVGRRCGDGTQRVNSFNPNGMPPVAYREFVNSKLNVA